MKTRRDLPILDPPDRGDLCADCGGDLRVPRWPKGRNGCGCLARSVSASQRGYVDAAAARGTVTEDELRRYMQSGSFPPPEGEDV